MFHRKSTKKLAFFKIIVLRVTERFLIKNFFVGLTNISACRKRDFSTGGRFFCLRRKVRLIFRKPSGGRQNHFFSKLITVWLRKTQAPLILHTGALVSRFHRKNLREVHKFSRVCVCVSLDVNKIVQLFHTFFPPENSKPPENKLLTLLERSEAQILAGSLFEGDLRSFIACIRHRSVLWTIHFFEEKKLSKLLYDLIYI